MMIIAKWNKIWYVKQAEREIIFMGISKKNLETFAEKAVQELSQAVSLEQLEAAHAQYLGKKSELSNYFVQLKEMDLEDKKTWGPQLTDLKQQLVLLFDTCKKNITEKIAKQQIHMAQHFDVTAYKPRQFYGSLHPATPVIERLENIFISMGFSLIEGPEVEKETNNFDALNIPQDHPARDMFDTFWLDVPGMLMRTHTSNVQARAMKEQKPPFAAVSMGRCYRHEATDASHDVMFMQIEGIYIDKQVSVGNLCATIKTFVQAFFNNPDLDLRMRPGYFPFVEPGIEFDITCPFCKTGCSVCKKTGWLELGGSGLIHPHVFRFCGIDEQEYTGFAFGFGLTRLIMLLYGISDIRLLSTGKIDFLKQF